MIFFPTILISFIVFLFALPILFLMGYFHILTLSFGKLGISSDATFILLFLILIGSCINIPLTKKKLIYTERTRFFGLWRKPIMSVQAIAINLGGAIIPALLSFYFLYKGWQIGFDLYPIFKATALMALVSKFLAKIVPGKGITIPVFAPPVLAALLALIFAPGFASPAAFIIGSLGTLIGADLLNLKKAQRLSPGFLSIGGAGVFDGIFLVGIVSALLS